MAGLERISLAYLYKNVSRGNGKQFLNSSHFEIKNTTWRLCSEFEFQRPQYIIKNWNESNVLLPVLYNFAWKFTSLSKIIIFFFKHLHSRTFTTNMNQKSFYSHWQWFTLDSVLRSLDTIMLTSWAPHSLLFPCKEGAGRSTYLCSCPLFVLNFSTWINQSTHSRPSLS